MSTEWLTLSGETPVQTKPTREVMVQWDSKACAWGTGNLIEQSHVHLVNKAVRPVIENLTPNATILEIASGANNLGYYPSAFNFERVFATDISPKMLKYLREKCSGIKTVIADARDHLPFEEDSFDLALCFFGMRYFENQEDVVSELIRVVKPKGHICIVDYDNYVYNGPVCAFNANRLLEVVDSVGHLGFVHRLAGPSYGCEPALDFLEITKNPAVLK